MFSLLTPLLAHSTAFQIWAYLSDSDVDPAQGVACVQWLRANRPDVANEVLCLAYSVFCYQLNEAHHLGNVPSADLGKWFVSVDVNSSFDDARLSQIPLADTYEEACRLAVNTFNLDRLFSDQGVGACSATA